MRLALFLGLAMQCAYVMASWDAVDNNCNDGAKNLSGFGDCQTPNLDCVDIMFNALLWLFLIIA